MSGDGARACAAEALGSAALVATVVGSGVMAERLSGGNPALALLGNTLPTGAILVVLILAFAPISGAHFNPAVSAVFAVRGELARRRLAAYVCAQTVGAIAGTLLAHAMFDLTLLEVSTQSRTGVSQWLSEVVATFGLVGTILGVRHARRSAVPYAVGLYIAAAYWFTASTSFANPAVTIARSLTDTFAGIAPRDAPAFVASQLLGAVLAGSVLDWLLAKRAARKTPALRPAR